MKNKLLFLSLLPLLFAACISTQIVSSWRDPSITIKQGEIKKVLVLGLVKNESSRRIIEDKIVKNLKNTQGVASYSYLTQQDLSGTLDAAKEKIKKDGFDGIITMRLAKIEQDVNYVPGTYPTMFYSPWTYGAYIAPMYYDPGYYTVDDVYQVETNFYLLNPEKLAWTGITSTINPQKVDKAADDIAKVVREKMIEENFLQ